MLINNAKPAGGTRAALELVFVQSGQVCVVDKLKGTPTPATERTVWRRDVTKTSIPFKHVVKT